MERWTTETEAHRNEVLHSSAEHANSVGSSCSADNTAQSEPPHSAPSAFRPQESRAGSVARVKQSWQFAGAGACALGC